MSLISFKLHSSVFKLYLNVYTKLGGVSVNFIKTNLISLCCFSFLSVNFLEEFSCDLQKTVDSETQSLCQNQRFHERRSDWILLHDGKWGIKLKTRDLTSCQTREEEENKVLILISCPIKQTPSSETSVLRFFKKEKSLWWFLTWSFLFVWSFLTEFLGNRRQEICSNDHF